jgi:hypothetical protein
MRRNAVLTLFICEFHSIISASYMWWSNAKYRNSIWYSICSKRSKYLLAASETDDVDICTLGLFYALYINIHKEPRNQHFSTNQEVWADCIPRKSRRGQKEATHDIQKVRLPRIAREQLIGLVVPEKGGKIAMRYAQLNIGMLVSLNYSD